MLYIRKIESPRIWYINLENNLAPAGVRTMAAPPPFAGFSAGCADSGSELFGCYSPRNVTNPVGELFHELVGMMSGSPNGKQVQGAAPSLHREAIEKEVQVQLSLAVSGEVTPLTPWQEMFDHASSGRGLVSVEKEAVGGAMPGQPR